MNNVWVLIKKNYKKMHISGIGYQTYERAKADLDKMVETGMNRINEYTLYDNSTDTEYEIKPVVVMK